VAAVAGNLRVGPQFDASEYDKATEVVAGRLDRRLERFDDEQLELELTVKDRDTPQQRVTLECWIAVSGRTRFVGTSTQDDLWGAVRETAEDVQKQVNKFLTKREDARRS
jgi:ribosome-associated translation inhibitor RaiA